MDMMSESLVYIPGINFYAELRMAKWHLNPAILKMVFCNTVLLWNMLLPSSLNFGIQYEFTCVFLNNSPVIPRITLDKSNFRILTRSNFTLKKINHFLLWHIIRINLLWHLGLHVKEISHIYLTCETFGVRHVIWYCVVRGYSQHCC